MFSGEPQRVNKPTGSGFLSWPTGVVIVWGVATVTVGVDVPPLGLLPLRISTWLEIAFTQWSVSDGLSGYIKKTRFSVPTANACPCLFFFSFLTYESPDSSIIPVATSSFFSELEQNQIVRHLLCLEVVKLVPL